MIPPYDVKIVEKTQKIGDTTVLFVKFIDHGQYTEQTHGLIFHNHLEHMYSRLKKYYGYGIHGNIYIVSNPDLTYPDSNGEYIPDKVKRVLPANFKPEDSGWSFEKKLHL